MQFSTYQPVDLIFKLIVPEKIFPFLDRRQRLLAPQKRQIVCYTMFNKRLARLLHLGGHAVRALFGL